MLAMIVKEFRQVGRDRRTLAMLIVMPVVLLLVFGYAASFDVEEIPTAVVGQSAGFASSGRGGSARQGGGGRSPVAKRSEPDGGEQVCAESRDEGVH